MPRIGLATDRKRSKCAPSALSNALPALPRTRPGDHRKKCSRSPTDGVIPLTDFSGVMHIGICLGRAAKTSCVPALGWAFDLKVILQHRALGAGANPLG